MILVGDIGGTNTRLAVFEAQDNHLQLVIHDTFPSRTHANLDEIVQHFVHTHQVRAALACFGVAGPVRHGRCEATNLPWVVDAHHLAQVVGLDTVWLINDLEAQAYGTAVIDSKDFVILNEGIPGAQSNAAVIAAGTGLGEAGLYWDGTQHWPFATEGGHGSFSPTNDLEVELLRYLLTRFTHVSWERLLSGPGLHNIYTFLRDTGHSEEPGWLHERLQHQDPPAIISSLALQKQADICVQALDLFVTLYGAEAGNVALKLMATGGIFVGGGIAPKIVEKLTDGAFMQAFRAKGRMQALLETIPVRVIRNDQAALFGAAHCATLRAASR